MVIRQRKTKRHDPEDLPSFSNHEIVTLAVFLLGGRSTHADTEDVAMKANEIAPGRFSWRKYPTQVNLELVRVYLSDAKKREKGEYLIGSGTDGWLLTETGFTFAKKAVKGLPKVDLSRTVIGPKEKRWRRSERARLLGSPAFRKFVTDGPGAVSAQEAATFFRIDDYVVGQLKEEKLTRILNAFGDDAEIGKAVHQFARKVRSITHANSSD
jgi:hypothetical protein